MRECANIEACSLSLLFDPNFPKTVAKAMSFRAAAPRCTRAWSASGRIAR
ncbi:hypothetical protein [Moorena sp. SIO3A2]|nr:hypothetical protein [Moorena sp. SIO3A2]